MSRRFLQDYEGEEKISILLGDESKTIITPSFSPLFDNSVTFRFEILHQKVKQIRKDVSDLFLFKLKLVKLSSADISSTLEVTVEVKINHAVESFETYDTRYSINVSKMNDITFKDVIEEWEEVRYKFSFYNSSDLNMIYKLTFHDSCKPSQFKPDFENFSQNRSLEQKSLFKNYRSMYEPSVLSDIVFHVGDKSLPAHKVIIAAHSSVFKNMMIHEFQESKTNSITITDATPEIFDLFLKYLYSGEIEDKSWDSLKKLYLLADKYDVGILKDSCTNQVISILSVNFICEIIELAYKFSDPNLKTAAINFAVDHIKEIACRDDWKELVSVHPLIGYEVTVNFIPK